MDNTYEDNLHYAALVNDLGVKLDKRRVAMLAKIVDTELQLLLVLHEKMEKRKEKILC